MLITCVIWTYLFEIFNILFFFTINVVFSSIHLWRFMKLNIIGFLIL